MENKTCQFCGKKNETVITYRQRTMYTDDRMNEVTACPECKKINDSYLDEMWANYYAGVLD